MGALVPMDFGAITSTARKPFLQQRFRFTKQLLSKLADTPNGHYFVDDLDRQFFCN